MNDDQDEKWGELVVDIALIQQSALRKVSAAFDKAPKSFANPRDYRKERCAFARSVVKGIDNYMRGELGEVAQKMNQLTGKAKD